MLTICTIKTINKHIYLIIFNFTLEHFPSVFGRKDNPVHLKRRPKIVVISYTMLSRLKESIMQLRWEIVIIDESHHIRCSKKKLEPREVNHFSDFYLELTLFKKIDCDSVWVFQYPLFFCKEFCIFIV